MPYFVYILYSVKFDTFYVGQSVDCCDRLKRHNAGYESATKPYIPWELVWYTQKSSRAEAMKLEQKLKNLSKQRLLQFIEKYK